METLKFKTTIKCSGCVAKSTPFLNEVIGQDNWEVDIQDPNKILTVTTKESIHPEAIIMAVENAGYKAEPVAEPNNKS